MKRWRFLSAICAFAISCATMPIVTVNAAESTDISLEPVYEFPVVGEVYIYEGQNYHLGDYTEMNIRVQVFIEPDGNTEFLFLADEDFEYESDKNYTVTIDNRTRIEEHSLNVDAPYWGSYRYGACYDAREQYIVGINRETGETTCTFDKIVYDNSYVHFCDDKNRMIFCFKEQPANENEPYRYASSGKTTINKGNILGRAEVNLSHSTIYVSEDQQQFIVENGEKQYIDDDMFVTLMIDGTSITKEIGLHYDDSPAMIYKQGDANNDGSLSVTDVVLLQKWLLAEPDVHFDTWCSADMNHDSRLDVFDLCLMKRALFNK